MSQTLALPLTVAASGSLAVLAQDSAAEVAQSVAGLLSTTVGERAALPAYGITDPLGAVEVDEAEIAQAIATWDDRVTSAQIDQIASTLADGSTSDIVTVTLQTIGA